MIPETVENPRYATDDSSGIEIPMLLVDLDGLPVAIPSQQNLLYRYGTVVFCSWTAATKDMDDKFTRYQATVIIDGETVPRKFEAATSDPRVVQLARNFWRDVEDETFRPGPVRR